MNVGELFVKLGIQGGDKTLKTLQDNQKAFKGTATMALEAKAAIVGAIYALQQLFSASNRAGTDLTNFNASLGVSARTLQQYQYAARQVGIDNKAVEASFRGLQATMTKTLMGEGAPKGLARVAQLTGDINPEDILEFSKAPEKLLQRLQQYSAMEKDAGFRNEVLKSFGLGDDMIAALNRQAFRPEILNRAPVYSEKEIAALDKANVAWSNLGNKIEMAVGRFNARYGNDIVDGITKGIDKVLELADAFQVLADKLGTVQIISEGFKATFGWIGDLADIIKEVAKVQYSPEKNAEINGNISTFFTNELPGMMKLFGQSLMEDAKVNPFLSGKTPGVPSSQGAPRVEVVQPKTPLMIAAPPGVPSPGARLKDIAVPRPPQLPPAAAQAPAQSIEVNQTLQFNGNAATDPERAKRIHAEAVQKAYRQVSAQTRSN